jgi:hypothetical protein
MKKETRKSLDDLRLQWAGGRDAWLRVPLLATTSSEERENNKHNQKFIPSILTKVVKESKGDGCSGENCDENVVGGDIESSSSPWPQIVQESILFGISAYNPRGQETPLETNQTQQALLQKDIQRAIAEYYYRIDIDIDRDVLERYRYLGGRVLRTGLHTCLSTRDGEPGDGVEHDIGTELQSGGYL